MSTRSTGRHRAQARAKTPLTALAESVQLNAGNMSRRSAVVAVSSGLVVTLGVPVIGANNAASSDDSGAATASGLIPETTNEYMAPSEGAAVDLARFSAGVQAPEVVAVEAPTRVSREGGDRTATDGDSLEDSVNVPTTQAAEAVIEIAKRYIGLPYKYGGTSPDGFDCSGFMQFIFAKVGVDLPRTSSSQAAAGRQVSASQARRGDLVYTPGHIALYLGDGKMIESPRTGLSIRITTVRGNPKYIRVLD